MGGIPSSPASPLAEEALGIKFPSYYVKDPVNDDDLSLARGSWDLIVEDKCREYLAKKEELGMYCITWFHTVFYGQLFDLDPGARALFKRDIEQQGRMLVRMISFSLSSFHEGTNLRQSLEKLAIAHASKGVVWTQYNTMGDALFYSLRKVLASEFTQPINDAWIKIYSSMLRIVLPVAVREEKRMRLEPRDTEAEGAKDAL